MAGKKKKFIPVWIQVIFLLAILSGIPLLLIIYQSGRSGQSVSQVIHSFFRKESGTVNGPVSGKDYVEYRDFLRPVQIGNEMDGNPMISHLCTSDLNEDGLTDIVVADAEKNRITALILNRDETFSEIVLAEDILGPSHVQVFDFDKDGNPDILVSLLGMIFPNNDKIGSIVLLRNTGDLSFSKHVLIEKIARVSDVRAGDMDKDGDNDLIATQFGYDDGETRYMENIGGFQFRSRILQSLSGGINCPIHDFDNDGDLDFAVLISQEWEEIYIFTNNGKGEFTPSLVYGSSNSDFGSSSLNLHDLDKDGDMDMLYTNGDAFDYIPPRPRPWHGIQWLENKGGLTFEMHRLADLGGASNTAVVDADQDGDLDIFVTSEFNLWETPGAQSFIWLENTVNMNFIKHPIASDPTHLLTLDTLDYNKDGLTEFVTGGMHVYPPYDRKGRITLWINEWKKD